MRFLEERTQDNPKKQNAERWELGEALDLIEKFVDLDLVQTPVLGSRDRALPHQPSYELWFFHRDLEVASADFSRSCF